MSNHIDAAWRSYSEIVIHPLASDAQRMETRRAFYAGATALWGLFMGDLFEPGSEEPTAADEAAAAGIDAELKAFAEAVARGKA